PLRNINGSIKSKYSKTLLQSSPSSSLSFSSSLRQCESLSQPQPLYQPQETRKSSRQSRKAKGRAAAIGATGAPAADTAPTTDAAKLSACVSAASPSAIGSRYSSALSSLPPAAEDSPQPLGVVDGFWKDHRLSQRDANQCHREALASAPTSSSALASAPAPEKRAGTFSSSDSPISSMSSSSNPLSAPYTTWEAYVDDWTLQPESRIPEVEEKEEDEDVENDADGVDDEGLVEDEDGAVEPMPGSQQLTSAVATSRVASSDEADEASDNRLFLFRKLPDITDIVNTLQNHDDMDYDQLAHSIDAVNKILYQYQNEFVATTAVVDDWENAQRRATDDVNAEKLLVPKEFLLKGYSTKSMTAKESEIHAVRMMDRLMADVYFFRHDPHISKVGRQDPLDQPHEAAPNHCDVRRSLRNDPNKTAKGTDHADPNIITGKRMRKPREMFDGQPNSRSATPALQTVSKRSTRSKRGEDELLDSNPGANSVSGSFNSNASFSGLGATAAALGLSEAHQQSSTPSTPVPAPASAPSLSTPTKKGKPDSGPNPRKRRRIKNEEPAPAVEEPASEYEELEREEEKVPEPEPAPEPVEEEEPPRKRRVRRTKVQIAADKAAAEAAQAQAQAEAEAEAESEATAVDAASSTVPPSAATSDFEADDEPAKKRIVSLMVPNLHVVRGSSTTSSKTTTPASTGKRGRKGKSSGKDAPTPPVNGSGRRKASSTIQPSPPTFTPNDNIAGPPSGPVVFPGAQPPPNHNGQIMWNSNPNKHNKLEGGSGRGRGRGGRRSTGGASHASQNSPLAQSQAPQPAQSPIDSSHMQQLPPHSQSQVPPPHLMHMQNQPMYDNKQPPLSHMPTIIAHYPPLQHQHQHQHQHQLPPHSMAPQSGNGGSSSHPASHHHSHSQTPPYGGSHIQYAPKTQFIQHSHTMPPQHSHVPMHGHSHPPLGHSHGHSHSHSHGHNNSHGMPPPPPVAASAGIPTSGSQINGSVGPDGDNRVRIKMVKPNQKPINLDNVVMGSKEYAQMTKSEKMSHSMKNRWKSGSMQGAVDKRKATLARKKQDRDPVPGNSSNNSNSSRAVNGTPAAHPTDSGSPTQSAHPIAYANPNSVAPMSLYPHHSQPPHMHSHSQIPPPPPQQRGQHPHGIFITQPPQPGYPQQGQQKQHVNLPPPPMGPQSHQQPHPSQQQEQMNTLNISHYPPSQP
ncbi:hypothetical protein Cpir12675_006852, partial [Ceratocystis pirilliformis]